MPDRVLTLRELNRATLARQMLLERKPLATRDAVQRLAGLQAQVAGPPFIGLWTRLREFRRGDLIDLMAQRQVVRATMMRSTLHLVTGEDYTTFRGTLQPALTRALRAFFGQRAAGLDIDRLVDAARPYMTEEPRTGTALRAYLAALEPDRDPDALLYALRTHLPMVQVPTAGMWGYAANPPYVAVESWLGRSPVDSDTPTLARRYLAAFGPATVRDFQTWSGLTRAQAAFDALQGELRSFRDERGVELFDLAGMPVPPADIVAPPGFLPEYDNLLLAHSDRTRVIAEEHRSKVFLSAGRVRATFLIDGFVHGAWKIEKHHKGVTLLIEPFMPVPDDMRAALMDEAERLIRFVAPSAATYTVQSREALSG